MLADEHHRAGEVRVRERGPGDQQLSFERIDAPTCTPLGREALALVDPVDAYVDFGTRHDMFVVGHTLVWHTQVPGWVFEDAAGQPLTRDALLARTWKENTYVTVRSVEANLTRVYAKLGLGSLFMLGGLWMIW